MTILCVGMRGLSKQDVLVRVQLLTEARSAPCAGPAGRTSRRCTLHAAGTGTLQHFKSAP